MTGVLHANGSDRASAEPYDQVVNGATASPACAEFPVESERALSLLILSDVRFMREGLADVLRREAHAIQTVSVAAEVGEALALVSMDIPDLVLIDAALPDGLAAVGRLREQTPEIRIIALAVAE